MSNPNFGKFGQSSYYRYLFLILFLGIYIPLLIFSFLALAITQETTGLPWDVPILESIHKTSTPFLDKLASIITPYGHVVGAGILTLVLSLVFVIRKQWYFLTYLLITIWGGLGIASIAKSLLHRDRPHLWELFYPLPTSYSFPSGHAMMSLTMVISLIVLAWGSFWLGGVLIFGSLFVIAIAWTRLYLGVHFPSDIIAGWMLAIAWGSSVNFLLKRYLKPEKTISNEKY